MSSLLPPSNRVFHAPLHGLRGIAVLYVVVSHFGNSNVFLLPLPHDAIGKVGVWIFFALSAFLLTSHLCRDLENGSSKLVALMQYAIRRVFRIYPLYIVVLIGHALVRDISPVEILKHLLLIQGWGELWAISVEFQYYFIIPFIATATLYWRRQHVALLLAGALAVSLFHGISQPAGVFSNQLNIIPKLAPFLLGSMLALLPHDKMSIDQAYIPKLSLFVPLVCIVGLVISTVLYRCLVNTCIPSSLAPWLSIAIAASVTGVMYAALRVNAIAGLLGAKPLVMLGEISFSLYLLHMFVLRAMPRTGFLSDGFDAWLLLLLSIFCATIFYRVVEIPGIRAGGLVSRKLGDLVSRRYG